ncbi:hypothetical protein AAG570_006494 [Ranatra chinensis]|uniref:Uncharacterized protein n=1 Tax=Ranatra chinensis TaxID=642074 RepID=A0ABD0YU85_9HEMI
MVISRNRFGPTNYECSWDVLDAAHSSGGCTKPVLITAVAVVLGSCLADRECAVVQTTDVRSPCFLQVVPGLQEDVPPFAYLANLPEPSPGVPCPVLQTLNEEAPCYTLGRSTADGDVPAYYLTVPLPQGADDTEILIERLRTKKRRSEEPQPLQEDDNVVPHLGTETTYGVPRKL